MLFNRKIEIDIEGLPKTLSYPELKIKFKGEIDSDDEENIFEIEFYNLDDNTINTIKENSQIKLRAGHEKTLGTLATGIVKDLNTTYKNANKITEITMTTGSKSWTEDYISRSFNGPISAKKVLERLIPSSGLDLGVINLNKNVSYKTGLAVRGKIINIIKRIAKDCNTPITINNQKISFTKTEVMQGYLISSSSGLISSPKKILKKDSDADYTIKIILNPNIKLKSRIKLESKNVSGQFDIVKAKFNKDFTIDLNLKGA